MPLHWYVVVYEYDYQHYPGFCKDCAAKDSIYEQIILFTYAKPIAQMCIQHILLLSALSTKHPEVVYFSVFGSA